MNVSGMEAPASRRLSGPVSCMQLFNQTLLLGFDSKCVKSLSLVLLFATLAYLTCVCVLYVVCCVLYSSPGFSVHGILQAKILEWVAISFSKGIRILVSCVAGIFVTA